MRMIDADALIADLAYDVQVDEDSLVYEELSDDNRTIIQFDKDCKQNAIDILNHAPTIEPQRKIGWWQRHYSRPNVYADLWWHCSVCGYKNDNQYANHYHHFCPNCGSLMEVENEC